MMKPLYQKNDSGKWRTGCCKTSFLFILSFISLFSCQTGKSEFHPDPGFTKYVTSFTAGEIPVKSTIIVQLAEAIPGLENGKPLPEKLFRINPQTEGKVVLRNDGIIEFQPAAPLKQGTRYTVTFFLEKLLEVEKAFRKFSFSFNTIKQNFMVEAEGLLADPAEGSSSMSYSGSVTTADVADASDAEQVVTALYNGQKAILEWTHSPDRRTHKFTVRDLVRDISKRSELVVEYNGKSLGVNNKGKVTVNVPSLGEFIIIGARESIDTEQKVVLFFSDPLDRDQPVEGMAELEGGSRFTWQIDGNRLVLWPSEKIYGDRKVTVYKGFRSAAGKTLQETSVINLFFRNLKPEIRFVGKGIIVPDQGRLSIPFEAVSLKAVDLRIIKIYPSNIRQFLQENQMDGGDDLKKVGRLVYNGKIGLNPDKQEKLYRWNTYRIDLDRYVKLEKRAIYRVELRFKRAYALVGCEGYRPPADTLSEQSKLENWDSPGWYSTYYWPDNYEWEERDNPCSDSYYTSERFVSRNIFASNLGILAKEGDGFRFTFAVTNLNTALPEEKVEVTLFSLQHQELGKTVTDKKGLASITLDQKPFVAVASKGDQTGYLRIDDGSALSLSNFDVTGEVVQEGIKGFFYGERGVWRPGEQMFLNFILDDPGNRLPENMPVIFRLVNSRGQEAYRRVATSSENGFYHFPVSTQPDDPTGNWYAKIQAGGASFEKRIRVETVKPNRLKVDLKLPGFIQAGSKQQAVLRSSWLHGATATSLKSVVEAELFPVKTVFKGYEKFSFDNPGDLFVPTKQVVFEGRLSDKGEVSFPLEFQKPASAAGKMKAWFTTRVFEEGGDFSIHTEQAEFSPYTRYIGLRMPEEEDGWYQTDTTYHPELVSLSGEGKPIPLGNVEVSLFKVDWRWWWESGDDYLARYVSGKNVRPVKTWSFNSGEPALTFDLQIKYNDWNDNGRYLLFARDKESGHAAGVVFYMSEWGGWRSDALAEGATILSLRTDKEKYAPGEKIQVTIPSSVDGRALVSLENGRQAEDIFWVETQENETVFSVEVKPGMAPTLYIYVTLLQPYGSAKNDAPLRLYGVQAVAVEDPSTVLVPEIAMTEELEPDKEFTVTVKEKNNRQMTYTLAIVDEGLLDLTGFKTPDPHGYFFAREALGVKTYDLFDLVAGAYGARLEKAFAVGGDADFRISGKREANRFQPVVLYTGPFTLGKNQTGRHTFKMPSYVGSVRAMVVAGGGGAFGKGEKTAFVRKAVMVLATLPRVLGTGDQFSLPVSVFAMKETTRGAKISVETNELLVLEGEPVQSIVFTQPGEKMVYFKLKAGGKTGTGKVKIVASSENETSYQEVELDIRNPNPQVVNEDSRLLDPGQSWSAEIDLPGMSGTNDAELELSTIPSLNLSKHLDGVVQYPHQCSEQVTSAGFSQLYLDKLIPLSSEEKYQNGENIKDIIRKLMGSQTGSGGFAYWPGQNSPDDWCSSYAGHFLTEASGKGYSVPESVMKKWLAFQAGRARIWKPALNGDPFIQQQETLAQAYRLYTLALAGVPETGVMNRFREEVKGMVQARWRLAAAFLLAGQPQAADLLLQNLPLQTDPYISPGFTFGSELRDKALILETLLLKKERNKAFVLIAEMADEIGRSSWMSTQTAAWTLYAISKFFDTPAGQSGLMATITMKGKKEKYQTALPVIRIPIVTDQGDRIQASVANNGSAPLFARIVARGIPLTDTAGIRQNNLRMNSMFTDRNGKQVDPGSLPQGMDLFLHVTVIHPGYRGPYHEMVLTTQFPPGWEILNTRMTGLPEVSNPSFDYLDIRDDRVNTYFDLATSQRKTFRFALNAAYEGKFYLPAMVCEAMYDNSVYSRLPGQWITVKRD